MHNGKPIPGFFPATAMPDPDWWRALWPRPELVLASLGVQPHMLAVDLCCGDGLFTAPLATMTKRVIGIDIDSNMLALARAKVSAAGATNCNLVQGDAYAIAELVEQAVDFVLIANTFHGVPDKRRLALAVARILKPQGRFAVVNWHKRPREETPVLGQARGPKTEMRMTPDDVAATTEPAPLKLVKVIDLPPYHYGAIFEKREVEGECDG